MHCNLSIDRDGHHSIGRSRQAAAAHTGCTATCKRNRKPTQQPHAPVASSSSQHPASLHRSHPSSPAAVCRLHRGRIRGQCDFKTGKLHSQSRTLLRHRRGRPSCHCLGSARSTHAPSPSSWRHSSAGCLPAQQHVHPVLQPAAAAAAGIGMWCLQEAASVRREVASSLSYCGEGTDATPTDAAGRLRETAKPMVVAQVSLLFLRQRF